MKAKILRETFQVREDAIGSAEKRWGRWQMSRFRLPDGVPPDNQARTFAASSGEATEFKAPDTATPDFAIPASNAGFGIRENLKDAPAFVRAPDPAPHFAKVTIETDDEDDDEEVKNGLVHGSHPPAPVLVLVAIGLLLIAFAAFVVSQRQDPVLSDCASQPEWNQYNCRAN